jgi:Leucine-rich repeat (LRR) protein
VQLVLGSNQLNGSIPGSIGDLSSLQELYLYNNQISGSIPSSIANLEDLESIRLDGNQLSGLIPTAIADLPNLSFCSLRSEFGNSDLCRIESFMACGTYISGKLLLDLTILIVCAFNQTTASVEETPSTTDHPITTEQPEQTPLLEELVSTV